ncbi:hypothetical protein AB1Y20_010058 [Prymnesium parvum]|uniref:Tryptophan synthase beta chain-like PALP domain-containing protein n=1 Tax=Prymnesium parvum TaxID=97485 RepID=A0AB34K3U4_PRYPA
MRAPPILPRALGDRVVWEVRDYECCLIPAVCGNKARKFFALASEPEPRHLVSHGGSQSNAMLALATLAAHQQVGFSYHTKPLPGWLRRNPIGNLARALSLGMELVEHPSGASYEAARLCLQAGLLGSYVPQGGAYPGAEAGVRMLARDIGSWHTRRGGRPCLVVLPAGTGTTALYLSRHVPAGVRVFAVPCVGDHAYLQLQMNQLDIQSGGDGNPAVEMLCSKQAKVNFGSPSAELLQTWREAAGCGVLLDLLYGVVAWSVMQERLLTDAAAEHADIVYVNCGGHEGSMSQLARYRRAGLLSEEPSAVLAEVHRAAAL